MLYPVALEPDDSTARLARDRVLEQFEDWHAQHGTGDPADCVSDVELLLDWKIDYGDGVLTKWDHSDVHEFLLEWCPRKLSMSGAETATVPDSVGSYLTFLAAQGLIGPGPAAELTAFAHSCAGRFRTAMDDPRNFGMAKSIVAAALDDGVDLADPDQLQAWMEQFNNRPEDARRALLSGPEPQRPAIPPVALPSEAELAASRAAAPVLAMFASLAAYVGEGRKLTAKGNLTRADARALVGLLGTGDTVDPVIREQTYELQSAADLPTLTLVYQWARKAGVLRVAKGKVIATKKGLALAADLGAYFDVALEALLDLGPVSVQWQRERYFATPEISEVLDESALLMLALLYAEPGPVPFDGLAEAATEIVFDVYAFGNEVLARSLIAGRLAGMLDAFALAGVVQRDGVVDAEWPMPTRRGGTVQLTPAGVASTNRLLVEAGYEAPTGGEFAAASATELLRGTDGAEFTVFAAESNAWMACREPRQAADELASAAEKLEPHLAHAALLLVTQLDPDVVGPALRRVAHVPHLRGAVIASLVDLDLEPPTTQYDPGDESWFPDLLLFRLLGDDLDSAVRTLALVGDRPGQVALLERIWRQPSPATGFVLEALGRAHPDKRIAKAARKASFRHRSSALAR